MLYCRLICAEPYDLGRHWRLGLSHLPFGEMTPTSAWAFTKRSRPRLIIRREFCRVLITTRIRKQRGFPYARFVVGGLAEAT